MNKSILIATGTLILYSFIAIKNHSLSIFIGALFLLASAIYSINFTEEAAIIENLRNFRSYEFSVSRITKPTPTIFFKIISWLGLIVMAVGAILYILASIYKV